MSCSVDFPALYSNGFELVIRNTEGTTWTGTAVDVTGNRVHIGSYTLPAGTKGVAGHQGGFVEYYPWNSGTHTCGSLPHTSVVFGLPTTSTNGVGSLSSAYEYGECLGQVGFESHSTPQGVEVSVGF